MEDERRSDEVTKVRKKKKKKKRKEKKRERRRERGRGRGREEPTPMHPGGRTYGVFGVSGVFGVFGAFALHRERRDTQHRAGAVQRHGRVARREPDPAVDEHGELARGVVGRDRDGEGGGGAEEEGERGGAGDHAETPHRVYVVHKRATHVPQRFSTVLYILYILYGSATVYTVTESMYTSD